MVSKGLGDQGLGCQFRVCFEAAPPCIGINMLFFLVNGESLHNRQACQISGNVECVQVTLSQVVPRMLATHQWSVVRASHGSHGSESVLESVLGDQYVDHNRW